MARTDTLGNFLTDVAEAIREKKGTSETIQASQFDTEIANLPSGSADLDWQAIGYNTRPQYINDDYDHAKDIYDNWDNSQTDLTNKFHDDKNLVIMPLVDTSNVTNMGYCFNGCSKLKNIPLLDTSNVTRMMYMFITCTELQSIPLFDTKRVKETNYMFSACKSLLTVPLLDLSSVTNMTRMFENCNNLTDTSLDNILQMCINATSYTGTKTLARLGLTSGFYPASRIEALPHYQDFINAGWTIGY